MEDDPGRDFISGVPDCIMAKIFTKVPIRDVVKTSILSPSWRYRWTALTDLEFDDRSAGHYNEFAQEGFVNFITKCLLLHDGPIHKFSLRSKYLQSSPDIYQWLLFVSRKDVRELILELREGELFRATSRIFSCKNLTRLELVRCDLDPPLNFKGFMCLKYLNLQQVPPAATEHLISSCPLLENLNLQQVLIPPADIERLISSCPLLENLTLSWSLGSLELTVRVPNLRRLSLKGEFKDLCLADTPNLVAVSVTMYMTHDIEEHFEQSSSCHFDKFLGRVPKLESLIGRGSFTKYLSIGIDRGLNNITYHHLRVIKLCQVSFDDMKEVLVVLQLMFKSPNLRALQISGDLNTPTARTALDLQFWGEGFPFNRTFRQLKTVKLTDLSGLPHEMKFIEYLLKNSPGLEEMSITPSIFVIDARLNMSVELLNFRRASPGASVVFTQKSVRDGL